MPNRTSQGRQRYTLTVGGRSFSDWVTADIADHDIQTGRVTPGGSKGDVVTVGIATVGATHTLRGQYHEGAYQFIKRYRGHNATLSGSVIDVDGRRVGRGDTYRGVIKGITRDGLNTETGDFLGLSVRFEADGDVG